MPENRLAGGTCGGLTGCVMGVVRGGGGPGRGCRGRCCCLCDPPLPPPWPGGGGGGGCRVPGEGSGACSWSEKGSKPRMFPAPPFRTNEHCVLQMLSLLTASWPNSNTSWRQLLIFKDWHWAWNKTISLLLLFSQPSQLLITPSFVHVQLVQGEIFLEDPMAMLSPFTLHCVTSSLQWERSRSEME